MGSRENALLRQELNKLAAQILTAAGAANTPLPNAPVPQLYEPTIETRRVEEPMPDFVARREEALVDVASDEPGEPKVPEASSEVEADRPVATGAQADHPAEDVAEHPADNGAPTENETPEPRGSLAKMLTGRRAKRGSKGRRESLSERLKGVSAESPDL